MTAMAEDSVAVKTPLKIPPMIMTAAINPGIASANAFTKARQPGNDPRG